MRGFDLEAESFFFCFFDFSVDGGYQHFLVAFLALVTFFEDVVSALEFSDFFEPALLAFDGRRYWG